MEMKREESILSEIENTCTLLNEEVDRVNSYFNHVSDRLKRAMLGIEAVSDFIRVDMNLVNRFCAPNGVHKTPEKQQGIWLCYGRRKDGWGFSLTTMIPFKEELDGSKGIPHNLVSYKLEECPRWARIIASQGMPSLLERIRKESHLYVEWCKSVIKKTYEDFPNSLDDIDEKLSQDQPTH